MFAFLAKSKELRAVGRASAIPVTFGVNEPFLFGAPMVLNPVFLVPFVLAPVANAWVFKLFIDVLGMNGFLYTLPWTTPAPLGIVLGCGLSPLSFVFVAVALVMDFVIYYPFFKTYDMEKCEEEAQIEAEELEARAADKAARMSDAFQGRTKASELADGSAAAPATSESGAGKASAPGADALSGKRVLVLCAGGGTSGLLANALAKAALEQGIDLESAAGAYGAHLDIMPDFDLVVLAPQVASYYEDLKLDADRMGVRAAACEGRQYIALTRNGEAALAFVREQLAQ
jgi:PTS system lactose-specific IIC component